MRLEDKNGNPQSECNRAGDFSFLNFLSMMVSQLGEIKNKGREGENDGNLNRTMER